MTLGLFSRWIFRGARDRLLSCRLPESNFGSLRAAALSQRASERLICSE